MTYAGAPAQPKTDPHYLTQLHIRRQNPKHIVTTQQTRCHCPNKDPQSPIQTLRFRHTPSQPNTHRHSQTQTSFPPTHTSIPLHTKKQPVKQWHSPTQKGQTFTGSEPHPPPVMHCAEGQSGSALVQSRHRHSCAAGGGISAATRVEAAAGAPTQRPPLMATVSPARTEGTVRNSGEKAYASQTCSTEIRAHFLTYLLSL